LFLRRFDYSRPDSIQDDKVYLGDDQNTLVSITYSRDASKKVLYMAGGYRKSGTNFALCDGYFLARVNYETMKVDFMEMTPFANGYAKNASAGLFMGKQSDDQFSHLFTKFLRPNADGTFNLVLQCLPSNSNPRTGKTYWMSAGYTEIKLNAEGKPLWLTYIPQGSVSDEYYDISPYIRTNSKGETEYFYLGSEGDVTATRMQDANKGKNGMVYARVNDKGERTSAMVYIKKELKAVKRLDPGDLMSISDNELGFLFYPSGSSIVVGRVMIKY
jgi:hypothetical protein